MGLCGLVAPFFSVLPFHALSGFCDTASLSCWAEGAGDRLCEQNLGLYGEAGDAFQSWTCFPFITCILVPDKLSHYLPSFLSFLYFLISFLPFSPPQFLESLSLHFYLVSPGTVLF